MENPVKQRLADFIQSEGLSVRNCWHKPLQWLCGCAVTADELMLLRHAALPAALARVRDLFIFSAYIGLAQTVVDDGAKLAGKIR